MMTATDVQTARIDCLAALEALAAWRTDQVVVTTMVTAREWPRYSRRQDLDIPFIGCMGKASSLGLGIALGRPDRSVWVFDGDGSLLMNLGSLATIATAAPANLAVIVWDNGAYQITGGQPAATARGTDLVTVARGAGIASSRWVTDEEAFAAAIEHALRTDGPHFIAARVDSSPGAARPERDPVVLKDRFMRGIGAKK